MPIPYRDADELEELGTAGYLKIEPLSAGSGFLGALFLINVRGEPIEFTYNRIETPHTFLWRQDDICRHAARKLTASLLSLCPRTPRLILCLAEEVGSELFCQDIHVAMPVCRIAPAIKAVPYSGAEIQDIIECTEPMNLFWYPSKPHEESIEYRLLRELTYRGLLTEPFSRATIGLKEVFGLEVGEVK
jgi:hypothetical protein